MNNLEKRLNALAGVERQLGTRLTKEKVHWMTEIMVDIYQNANDESRTLLCDIMMISILDRLLKLLKNNKCYYEDDYEKLNSIHWGLHNNEDVNSLL